MISAFTMPYLLRSIIVDNLFHLELCFRRLFRIPHPKVFLVPVLISYTIAPKVSITNTTQILYHKTAFLSKNILYFQTLPLTQTVQCSTNSHHFGRSNLTGSAVFRHSCPSASPMVCVRRRDLAKLTFQSWCNKQYFYTEKENSLFTFASPCDTMYQVKIGNYFGIFLRIKGFFHGISGKFIVFNFFLILINCSRSGLQLIENRRMLLKIYPAYLPKISQSKS